MKYVRKVLLFIGSLCIAGVALFVSVGYVYHKKVTNLNPIVEVVKEIRSDEHYVRLDQMNPMFIKASIAIEDRRFYDHGGVDYFSLARAFISNVFANKIVGGGSTITQQLAKNLYYSYNPSYIRKMSEIFTAYELEENYSKEEILELYFNVINYGDNHIGVYEASNGYFQKLPNQLSFDECTLLAGLPQSPSNFQLSNHSEAARIRQKQVLQAMYEQNLITQEQLKQYD